MVTVVGAVERIATSFYPSIILTVEDVNIEKKLVQDTASTGGSSVMSIQMDTECFATTVTSLLDSMATVHTEI